MATITLTANTNYSALSLANGDTIDLAGFILTINTDPTHSDITVISPGTSGTVAITGARDLGSWDFEAGTNGSSGMIPTLPAGASIKSVTAGTTSNARGVGTNNGTIGTANGFSANASIGVSVNNGTIYVANAGSGSNSFGVENNLGYVGTATGGGSFAYGVSGNNGYMDLAIGSTSFSNASGVDVNTGICLKITDNLGKGMRSSRPPACLFSGPDVNGAVPSNVKTIYSIGKLSDLATIAVDATVIELSEGGGIPIGRIISGGV